MLGVRIVLRHEPFRKLVIDLFRLLAETEIDQRTVPGPTHGDCLSRAMAPVWWPARRALIAGARGPARDGRLASRTAPCRPGPCLLYTSPSPRDRTRTRM